jgi:hypothetical protein
MKVLNYDWKSYRSLGEGLLLIHFHSTEEGGKWEGAQIFQSHNGSLVVAAVYTNNCREFPINLIMLLDFAHEAIIVDDRENSSHEDNSDDKDGAK